MSIFEVDARPSYHMSFGWSVANSGPVETTAFDLELSFILPLVAQEDELAVQQEGLQGVKVLPCDIHMDVQGTSLALAVRLLARLYSHIQWGGQEHLRVPPPLFFILLMGPDPPPPPPWLPALCALLA